MTDCGPVPTDAAPGDGAAAPGGGGGRGGGAGWGGGRRRAAPDPDAPMPDMLVDIALASPAALAIVPMQDLLGLGGEGRMNVPGLVDERNWSWRLEPGALTPELAARLREATAEAGRLPRARRPTGRSGPGSAR
jgi:hypothetical protein